MFSRVSSAGRCVCASLSLVRSTAAQLTGTELQRARAVWRQRFGDQPADTPQERARQMRFLATRGFAADVVRRVVRGGDEWE